MSTDPIDTSALGKPVEIAQISRELKNLWDSSAGGMTRASLINFAVCFRGAAAIAENTNFIVEFTRHHACRALLLCLEPDSAENKISAWINAHCHLTRAGAKQVCCEQISFLFEGHTEQRLANALFAHLDSDLPLYLWWQGEFPEQIDETLWAWVDRLIYDSQTWRDPKQQLRLLRDSMDRAQSRLTLCDLNWARTLHLRQATAQMFDYPENLVVLNGLERVEIKHAPEYRSTALLLVAWFAAQLELTNPERVPTGFAFHRKKEQVQFDLVAEPGRSISLCELTAPSGRVRLQRDLQGEFFRVEVQLTDGKTFQHLLPAGSNATTSLLLWEISGGSRHQIYRRTLDVIEELL